MDSPASNAAPAAPTPSTPSTPTAAPTQNAAPAASSRPNSTPPPPVEGQAQPAEAKPETPAEKKSRLLKAKVFGQEKEYNIDEMPDEELAHRIQMSEAARKHISESAALKKQFQEIVEGIKRDPFGMLKDPVFGVNLDELAEKRLAERYKESTLPESERKALEAQRKVQEYERKVQEYEQREKSRQQAEVEQRVEAELKRTFKTALESGGLPVNDTTMYLLAEEADIADRDGIQLSPQQLAHRVKEKMRGFAKHTFTGLKGEALAKELGDDTVKEVLRYALERAKANKAQPQAPAAQPARAADLDDEPQRKPRRSYDEIREELLWG